MACKNVCRICSHLAISTAVALTDGNLVITLPQTSYRDGEKVCIVIAQAIPADTPITAPGFHATLLESTGGLVGDVSGWTLDVTLPASGSWRAGVRKVGGKVVLSVHPSGTSIIFR